MVVRVLDLEVQIQGLEVRSGVEKRWDMDALTEVSGLRNLEHRWARLHLTFSSCSVSVVDGIPILEVHLRELGFPKWPAFSFGLPPPQLSTALQAQLECGSAAIRRLHPHNFDVGAI
jgi:hypothetical protein